MAARKVAAPVGPRFVRHAKRPEWGIGRVTDVYAGLMRVLFTDGVVREFRADVLEPVAESDVPAEMLTAPTTPAPSAPVARPRARKARAV